MKAWKLILIGFGVIVIIMVMYIAYVMLTTKSHSPADEVIYTHDSQTITVNYCRPYKKGRLLFGDKGSDALETYGDVWRTGANEATVINFKEAVRINEVPIEPGRYTLWTIPGASEWIVIINTENTPGHWGIKFGGEANYDQQKDVVRIKVPVTPIEKEQEQFTIDFEDTDTGAIMKLTWGKIQVKVPIERR